MPITVGQSKKMPANCAYVFMDYCEEDGKEGK